MSNITPINNVLMQPIQWDGQVYFTSHYFHQQYRTNTGIDGGKYAELKNFNKLIRGIEAYQRYLDRADIVELTRDEAGSKLEPAFKATFGKPIMLINATAQVALTHHLDDEISKQVSVSVNAKAAQQVSESQPRLQDVAKNHRARLQLARMVGLKGPEAVLAANDWTRREEGVDVLGGLGIKSLTCSNQSQVATATELGEEAGVPGNGRSKAQYLNLLLWDLGYLETFMRRDSKGEYKPCWRITEKGIKSKHLDYANVEKENGQSSSIQTIRYYRSILEAIRDIDISDYDFKELALKRKEAHAA